MNDPVILTTEIPMLTFLVRRILGSTTPEEFTFNKGQLEGWFATEGVRIYQTYQLEELWRKSNESWRR